MQHSSQTVDANWFHTAFGAQYPWLYAHRSIEAAEPEARFAADVLELRPNDRLLDVACGMGRHLVHLKQRCRAVGLDFSRELLSLARQRLDAVPLVRADMRAMPFESAFDAATSFFTSFGYFLSASDNLQAAQNVSRGLRPGGRFFLDFVNKPHAMATLVTSSSRYQDDYEIRETRWIDANKRLNKSMELWRNGLRTATYQESVQLYDEREFRDLLERGGLTVQTFFGGFDGSALGEHSPRMIAVGRRS